MADLTSIKFRFRREGATGATINWYLREDDVDGDIVDSGSFNTGLYTQNVWSDVTITLDASDLVNGTYFFSLEPPNITSAFAGAAQKCEVAKSTTNAISADDGITLTEQRESGYPFDTWADINPLVDDYFYFVLEDDGGSTDGPNESLFWYLITQTAPYEAALGLIIEIDIAEGPETPTTPFPTDTAETVVNNQPIALTWIDPGAETENAATSFDVYFGTAFIGAEFQETVSTASWAVPENFHGTGVDYLNELQDYEWYIVAKNDAGEAQSATWTFQTSGTRGLGKAINPTPTDEAAGIAPTLETVAWQNGGGATKYDVYFGAAVDDLRFIKSIDSSAITALTDDSFSAGYFELSGSATQYWRIDAKNGFGTIAGDVWTFDTSTLKAPDFATAGGRGIVATVRRLVAVAKNRLYYEDI